MRVVARADAKEPERGPAVVGNEVCVVYRRAVLGWRGCARKADGRLPLLDPVNRDDVGEVANAQSVRLEKLLYDYDLLLR